MTNIILSSPLTVKDKELTEISLDFDKLSGNDLVKAESEVRSMGDSTPFLSVSMRYQAALAAKMIGCPVDDILALNAKDFQNITKEVAGFC